jgi:hypothetical protein
MKYTGWCQNDFNVQGYPRQGLLRAAPAVELVELREKVHE